MKEVSYFYLTSVLSGRNLRKKKSIPSGSWLGVAQCVHGPKSEVF